MRKVKKIMLVVLSATMWMFNVLSVAASADTEQMRDVNDNSRMYSDAISLGLGFSDGSVVMDCVVDAPYSTKSITLLFILREENALGNHIIVDTWSDSGTGYYFTEEYSYSPAVEGKEYELSVRVGIYDANGLVGYDYKTIRAVN
ncbi:MAG: hypothetical protein E7261_11670 [Lachnospiraceae bacterium]|nr:hypothetical protein [Lachnospiraceae bacterium]